MHQFQVSFPDAIKMAFEQYANFNGRSSRSEYWWWVLFTSLLGIIVSLFQSEIISGLVYLGIFLPSIAVGVRRLHDIGKSGWWYLINLIPLVGNIIFIVWACQDSQMHDNEYGEVPNLL